ncbi:hypothetical protein GCM10028810_51790 [Spirosoma litoris]
MRLAVAPFTDQQNNVSELGKFLAQQFSVYLIRNGLDVLDRSRVDVLMNENKMSANGLLDPKNQAALGQLAGIQLIVVGSTTPTGKSIELVITAIDVVRGSGIAGTDGSISRDNALNDLLRSTVKPGGGSSSSQETSSINTGNSTGQDLNYTIMGDKKMDLPKTTCLDGIGNNKGQVCFENITKQALILYQVKDSSIPYRPNVLIGTNGRNCSPLLDTSGYDKIGNKTYEFYFHMAEEEEENRQYGKMPLVVEGCKVIVRVINNERLFLSKTKPN